MITPVPLALRAASRACHAGKLLGPDCHGNFLVSRLAPKLFGQLSPDGPGPSFSPSTLRFPLSQGVRFALWRAFAMRDEEGRTVRTNLDGRMRVAERLGRAQ